MLEDEAVVVAIVAYIKVPVPDDRYLILVWDAGTGVENFPPLCGHSDSVRSIAFSPDGSKIVSGSNDKTIRVWEASSGAEILPPLRGHNDSIISVTFSLDGSKIISASCDETVGLWDASSGVRMLKVLQSSNKSDEICCSAFSPDG